MVWKTPQAGALDFREWMAYQESLYKVDLDVIFY
jgi:hypothetical protein